MTMELVLEHIIKLVICETYLYLINHIAKYKFIDTSYVRFKPSIIGLFSSLDSIVLHKSNNYLILNKRYDVLINSNKPNVKTLHHDLCKSYPKLVNPKLQHGFYFIHRLDYATSGAICVALHKRACSAASTAFQKRTTKKYYLALLRGHVSDEKVEINDAIGEDAREVNGSHRMCTGDSSWCVGPRVALTRLLVLQRGLFDDYPATKVLLQPITGRRHQLRVHCSHIGHTIIGDYTYSQKKDTVPLRTFLHAFRLVMPNTVEPIDVVTSDPFTPEYHSNWMPVETINTLNSDVYEKLAGDTS